MGAYQLGRVKLRPFFSFGVHPIWGATLAGPRPFCYKLAPSACHLGISKAFKEELVRESCSFAPHWQRLRLSLGTDLVERTP